MNLCEVLTVAGLLFPTWVASSSPEGGEIQTPPVSMRCATSSLCLRLRLTSLALLLLGTDPLIAWFRGNLQLTNSRSTHLSGPTTSWSCCSREPPQYYVKLPWKPNWQSPRQLSKGTPYHLAIHRSTRNKTKCPHGDGPWISIEYSLYLDGGKNPVPTK